jgi:hypothetical protein
LPSTCLLRISIIDDIKRGYRKKISRSNTLGATVFRIGLRLRRCIRRTHIWICKNNLSWIRGSGGGRGRARNKAATYNAILKRVRLTIVAVEKQ